MLEDRLLILKFKNGSQSALRRIYEKYRKYLLKLAAALLHDLSTAEDVVHDVFLQFAQSRKRLKLEGNLKSFLRTCVLNSARNKAKSEQIRSTVGLDGIEPIPAGSTNPDYLIILKEDSMRITNALAQIPYDQREVVVLHLHGDMKFKEIAVLQETSIKTILSRYRYGLEKLRVILNSEVINESY